MRYQLHRLQWDWIKNAILYSHYCKSRLCFSRFPPPAPPLFTSCSLPMCLFVVSFQNFIMSGRRRKTGVDNEDLIRLVQQRQYLWVCRDSQYKDSSQKSREWQEIVHIFFHSGTASRQLFRETSVSIFATLYAS